MTSSSKLMWRILALSAMAGIATACAAPAVDENAAGASSPLEDGPSIDALAAPTNVLAAKYVDVIRFTWQDNSSAEDGFLAECQPQGTTFFIPIWGAPANATTFDWHYRSAGPCGQEAQENRASFRIRARAADGTLGPPSPLVRSTPPAPTDLGATAIPARRIVLGWTDNSPYEAGFEIYRATEPEATPSRLTLVGTTGNDVTTYSDEGLTPGTTYYYQVLAIGTAGDRSPFTNVASAVALDYVVAKGADDD